MMTVDTSSADDWTVGDGADLFAIEATVAAAEAVLSQRFGSAITLIEPEDLAGTGPATVVRARVASSPFSLPKTLVIKRYPHHSSTDESDPFAQEAVSYQLFTALSPEDRICPELLAHDGERRILVIDDLGRAPTLQDKLCGSDARAAENALISWARSLGRLHASTASREADFDALLRRLGGTPVGQDPIPVAACAELPAFLTNDLGVSAPPDSVLARSARAKQARGSAAYRAFSPVDLSPDNNLVTGEGVHFLDFERGQVRSVLVDVAHLRVPFVSCVDDALALPPGMSEAMVAAWRSEVAEVWPTFADDREFADYLLDSQLLQLWSITWQLAPGLQPDADISATRRAAALVSWWQNLADQAEPAGEAELSQHASEVAEAIDTRFALGTKLAFYPAFR